MDICETTFSHEDFLQPVKYDLTEDAESARRISIGSSDAASSSSSSSNAHLSIQTSCDHFVTDDGYSDILEDYDILPTILGNGHYGTVRECLHRSTGEKFAVKSIEKRMISRLDHLRREVTLLRRIDDHPAIMKIIDCYEDFDYVHIITEMYTGGELFDKIIDSTTDRGCLSERQAANIIKSLLEAVQYLHSKDIVHRDIKPENILFESNEEGCTSIKLIDFGLSRRHGKNDGLMSNSVGTPYYMSPQVLQGKYDRTCDLWAIGIVAYIMLCGYPPFNGSTDDEVHASVRRGNLVFEDKVWGNLSEASGDFVSMLLCRDESEKTIGKTAVEALRHPWIINA